MLINKKLYPIILLVIGIVFFLIYMSSYSRPASIDILYGFDEPRDNLVSFFIKNYHETGSYKYPVPYYNILPKNITMAFTPRDAAQFNGYIVPKYSLGMFMSCSIITSIDKNISLIITPLMAVLSLISVYILIGKFFGEKIGLIASPLAFILPSVWMNAIQILSYDFFSLFFLVLGFFYYVKLIEKRNNKYYILSTLFLIISIFYQYTYLMYILPFLFYPIFLRRDIIINKQILIIIGVAIFSLLSIPIMNKELYGNFLVTGYQMEVLNVEEALGSADAVYFDIFRFDFIPKYVSMYLIKLMPLLSLGVLVGLLSVHSHNYGNKLKYYCLYFLYISIFTISYYGSHSNWGFNEYVVNAAFLRYLLPVLLLMLPFLILLLIKVNKKIAVFFIFVFIITGVVNTLVLDNGVIYLKEKIQENHEFHDMIIQNTESNSAILTKYSDKILFPDRYTLTAAYLGATTQNVEPQKFRFWEFPLDFEIIAYKLSFIADQNIPVYIVDISIKELKQPLQKNGYGIKDMKIRGTKKLYKLVKV